MHVLSAITYIVETISASNMNNNKTKNNMNQVIIMMERHFVANVFAVYFNA